MNEKYDFSKLRFRMLGWDDYLRFEALCRDSKRELTEFLSVGERMNRHLSLDYWNLFGELLKDNRLDLYGLFDGKKLLGLGIFTPSFMEFGCEIAYMIRGGFHGLGLGKMWMYLLLREALGRKRFLFVELHIDKANMPSVTIAEQLAHDRIDEWTSPLFGRQGPRSGHYYAYHAYENIFLQTAVSMNKTPLQLLSIFWQLWDEGIDARQFLPYEQHVERPTLRSTLRLATE